MEKAKFKGFHIFENGELKDLSFEDIEKYEKQGYKVEVRMVRKEDIKEMSIEFELPEKKEE